MVWNGANDPQEYPDEEEEPLDEEEAAALAVFTQFCARNDGEHWTPAMVTERARVMWAAGRDWARARREHVRPYLGR